MYLRVCTCFVLVLTYCDIIIYHDVHAPKLRSRSHLIFLGCTHIRGFMYMYIYTRRFMYIYTRLYEYIQIYLLDPRCVWWCTEVAWIHYDMRVCAKDIHLDAPLHP